MKHGLWIALLALAGCAGEKTHATDEAQTATTPAAETPAPKPVAKQTVVVYSGRSAVLMEPLFQQFTKTTGIEIKARYDKSTQVLAERLATEGAQTDADLFLAQDSGFLGALAKAGHLRPLPKAALDRVGAHAKAKDGLWLGTSGRLRVLVYSPERVKPEELPKSLADLADPKWKKRLGWAPGNGSFQAHVSALRQIWGDDKTSAFLKGVAANEPTVYPKNSPQVKAVSNGEIDIGWVNHYYLHKLKAANPGLKAANHSFPTKGDAGNVMMISGVAIPRHAKRVDTAETLVNFLVSKAAQTYFKEKVYEYPTVGDVAPPAAVSGLLENLSPVSQEALSDVGPTLTLLRELGLQ